MNQSDRNIYIKALIEGIDVNFSDVLEIDEFVTQFKSVLSKNKGFTGLVVGDADGILVSDEHDDPIIAATFNLKKVRFTVLQTPEDTTAEQALVVSKTILAIYTTLMIRKTNDQKSSKIKNGESFVYKFDDDGFGLR